MLCDTVTYDFHDEIFPMLCLCFLFGGGRLQGHREDMGGWGDEQNWVQYVKLTKNQ